MPRDPNATINGLGYWFDPSDRPDRLGHPRLTIVLNDQPTGRHFDPERVDLAAASEGGVERVVVAHPWVGPPRLRLVAGEIHMFDRRAKSIAAFTFGGEAEIEVLGSGTRLAITSPAPLLDRQPVGDIDVEGVLAEEFAILLAERSARAGEDTAGFERRLAQADILTLYAAALVFLKRKLGRLSRGEAEVAVRSLQTVYREIRILKEKGTWPSPEPSVERIL